MNDILKFFSRRLGKSGSPKKSTIKRIKREFRKVKKFKDISSNVVNKYIKNVSNVNLNKKLQQKINRAAKNVKNKAAFYNLKKTLIDSSIKFKSVKEKEKYYQKAIKRIKKGKNVNFRKLGLSKKNINIYDLDPDKQEFYETYRELILKANSGDSQAKKELADAYIKFKEEKEQERETLLSNILIKGL
jgi:hypothetical protein